MRGLGDLGGNAVSWIAASGSAIMVRQTRHEGLLWQPGARPAMPSPCGHHAAILIRSVSKSEDDGMHGYTRNRPQNDIVV